MTSLDAELASQRALAARLAAYDLAMRNLLFWLSTREGR
jgi:hypothetical protein